MPRPHHLLRLAFRTLSFRVGLLLLVLSLPLAVTGLREAAPRWRLDHGGTLTQGVIAGKRIEHVMRKDKSGKLTGTTSYLLMYEFATADGRVIAGRQAVSLPLWRSAKEGGRMAVRYLSSSPETNRLDREPLAPTSVTATAVTGVLLAVLALVLLGVGIRQAKRTMADLREA